MDAVKEITIWTDGSSCNHTYLLNGDKMVAYIKNGGTEPFYFSKPITISRSGRKFEKLSVNPFEVPKLESSIKEVAGSKGNVYYVDTETNTCTCPGYTFRGACKHVKELA
jgi:hypothetical protein